MWVNLKQLRLWHGNSHVYNWATIQRCTQISCCTPLLRELFQICNKCVYFVWFELCWTASKMVNSFNVLPTIQAIKGKLFHSEPIKYKTKTIVIASLQGRLLAFLHVLYSLDWLVLTKGFLFLIPLHSDHTLNIVVTSGVISSYRLLKMCFYCKLFL